MHKMANLRLLNYKDRLSVCRLLILQHKPKLGRTKPSTGLKHHASRGLDVAASK